MSTDWLKAKKKWIEPARGGGGEQKTIAKPFWENRPRSIELSIAKRRKKEKQKKCHPKPGIGKLRWYIVSRMFDKCRLLYTGCAHFNDRQVCEVHSEYLYLERWLYNSQYPCQKRKLNMNAVNYMHRQEFWKHGAILWFMPLVVKKLDNIHAEKTNRPNNINIQKQKKLIKQIQESRQLYKK